MITVFGSINVDLTFPVAGLPKPGETVLTPACFETIGGKGANQGVAAARDGATARFVGCIGAEDFGIKARDALARNGVDVSGVSTVAGATGLATIWIDSNGRNMIAVASGANGAARASALDAPPLQAQSVLVLQMEVPASEVAAAIRLGKQAGAKVLLNLAPALPLPRAALSQVDVLVLNEHEATTLCRTLGLAETGTDLATPDAQLRALAALLESCTIIITLGSEGAIGTQQGSVWRVGALPVTAVDTTGAGDCFVGVLATALHSGTALPDAMRRAAVAGSLACTIAGAQPSFPTGPQIDAAVTRSQPPVREPCP
jgi:ribokinase